MARLRTDLCEASLSFGIFYPTIFTLLCLPTPPLLPAPTGLRTTCAFVIVNCAPLSSKHDWLKRNSRYYACSFIRTFCLTPCIRYPPLFTKIQRVPTACLLNS